MKAIIHHLVIALILLAEIRPGAAQGTAFTYQGRLNDGGAPANGIYDLRFAVYDQAGNGNPVGNPETNSAVGVSNGLFTTTLDFGALFTGTSYWLDLAVRTNGAGAFVELAPRQPISPVPYALFANTASNLSGTISSAQLPSGVVTNGSGGVNVSGVFTGTGSGLTNLNASQLTSGVVPAGRLPANVALLNASQTFSGVNVFGGYTGIGSGTPNYRLSLGGDNLNTKVALWDGGSLAMGLGVGPQQFRIHLPGSDNRFSFLDTPEGANELMTILGTGNVGIGTNSPASKLHVIGDITASGNLTASSITASNLTSLGITVSGTITASNLSPIGVAASGDITAGGDITASGNVTASNVRLGSGGANYAASSGENLRMVRGSFAANGSIYWGSGFTIAHTSTGHYTITFTPAFSGNPSLILSPNSWNSGWSSLSPNAATIVVFQNSNTTFYDDNVDFLAIGPP